MKPAMRTYTSGDYLYRYPKHNPEKPNIHACMKNDMQEQKTPTLTPKKPTRSAAVYNVRFSSIIS